MKKNRKKQINTISKKLCLLNYLLFFINYKFKKVKHKTKNKIFMRITKKMNPVFLKKKR